ncbi:hypothetical protein [Streptomyces sp. NBC_00525]|uniref:hypothetical protein n=1 Tax=Streptomyces sp. NBC_00525 TaxID=2903660 RepID=UPI002E811262|nr:hypothetical protein [Streptomyces sp. NBC_00525]WUC95649.1 hypothetical protein OG710_19520 [Streptomyces sp. NBC_00525]
MSEGTGNPLPREVDQSMDGILGAEPRRRPTRWLTPAGLAVTGAGTLAAGFQGNMAVAAMSAAPSLLLGAFFFFGVVCPAVWSRKPQRQKAALAVMTSLLGTARRRNTTRRRSPAG